MREQRTQREQLNSAAAALEQLSLNGRAARRGGWRRSASLSQFWRRAVCAVCAVCAVQCSAAEELKERRREAEAAREVDTGGAALAAAAIPFPLPL